MSQLRRLGGIRHGISRRWLLLCLVVVVLAGAGIGLWVHRGGQDAAVRSQQLTIPVVDGPAHDQHVSLDATVYYPTSTPAPAVLISPGFGETKNSVDAQAQRMARDGFVVLAYSARGFGRSSGQIALNSPDYEVADASQLIDWLAARPEVVKDSTGDPRVGVTGGSYGGALSLMVAGLDHRVDAIAPVITYNDLSQALVPNNATTGSVGTSTPAVAADGPNGVFKRTWAGLLFGVGASGPTTDPPSAASVCGRFIAEVCQAYQEIAISGQASPQTVALLQRDSPLAVTGHIAAPTLLVQGEQDTLFGLDQADANARQISQAGTPVKMIWYDGGHDGAAPGTDQQDAITNWFRYYLMHQGSNPGTGFGYDVQGAFRTNGVATIRTVTAPAYPGLAGSADSTAGATAQRQTLTLAGPPDQTVVNPPGGSPAAISGMPSGGSGASALAGQLAVDMPGQFAEFASQPLTSQLLVAGASQINLLVSAVPGQTAGTAGAELFAKLYDVAPDGTRTLPGAAVAPIRVGPLPADGGPVRVTVTLPGIVRAVQAGHTLQLVVATTDSSYADQVQPAAYRISLAGPSGAAAAEALSVPVVPGHTSAGPLPVAQLIGIGVVIALCALAAGWVAIRRRRPVDVDPALVDVPLALENLAKSYPHGVHAVDALSFRVERGQVVGLLGPNGAGKTTALRMMMGLVMPTRGEIRVFGHRVRPGAPVLSRIGSFVEGSGFLPHLPGLANLKLYWQATGRPEAAAHIDEALEIAGLREAIHRKVGTYSQGMRQRLAIAQAMLGLPELLVLDEPTNGLDPPQIRDMRKVLRDYAATGRTVLVSSHLLSEVEQTCSHVVVMHKGRLVAAGEVAAIVTGNGETAFAVDNGQRAAEVLRDLDGVLEVSDVDNTGGVVEVRARLNGLPRAEAVRALVAAGVSVDQVGPRGRLEDAFLHMVGGE
ncbi:MAG TPA: alpha/beta fold hydrolase [Pseudonocardiaceae bacterium]